MGENTSWKERQNLFSIWKRRHVERKKSNSDLLGGIFWHAHRRLRGRLGGDGGISVGARARYIKNLTTPRSQAAERWSRPPSDWQCQFRRRKCDILRMTAAAPLHTKQSFFVLLGARGAAQADHDVAMATREHAARLLLLSRSSPSWPNKNLV